MVVACIDTSTFFGVLIQRAADMTLGSLFLVLLFIFMACIAFAAALSIQIEWTAIFLVPLALAFMICTQQFYAVGGTLLIYLAFMWVKNLPFR